MSEEVERKDSWHESVVESLGIPVLIAATICFLAIVSRFSGCVEKAGSRNLAKEKMKIEADLAAKIAGCGSLVANQQK